MSGITDSQGMMDDSKPTKPKSTTVAIKRDILTRLQGLKIIDDETPSSVIERLLAEHDLKSMQKVVLKKVR